MGAYWTASNKVQRNLQGLLPVLKSVACEWFLIFLLFIDGALSYFLTKFAHRCELQTPCLFCSRLDHILGDEKPQFYWSLFCSNHREEISFMVSCHKHGKLADARTMCERCLLSFTTESQCSPESRDLLLAKMGSNIGDCSSQYSSLKRDIGPRSGKKGLCSCCDKPLKSRHKARQLILKPSASRFSRPKIPLPRMPNHSHLHRRDGLRRTRDRSAESSTRGRLRKNSSADVLSPMGYDPRITSDSELLFCSGDGFSSITHDKSVMKQKKPVKSASRSKPKGLSIDVPPERKLLKTSRRRCRRGSSLSDLDSQLNDVQCVASDVVSSKRLGPGDHSLHPGNKKSDSSVPSNLIRPDDVHTLSIVSRDFLHDSAKDSKSEAPLPWNRPSAGPTSVEGELSFFFANVFAISLFSFYIFIFE